MKRKRPATFWMTNATIILGALCLQRQPQPQFQHALAVLNPYTGDRSHLEIRFAAPPNHLICGEPPFIR